MYRKGPWLRDIPSIKDIVNEGIKRLEETYKSDVNTLAKEILKPYEFIKMLESVCHEIYKEYENKIWEKYNQGEYGRVSPAEIEMSLKQSRASRGGITLEVIFEKVFEIYNIPHERNQRIKDSPPIDVIVSNRSVAERTPKNVIVIEIKREVRERWLESVGITYILRELHGFPKDLDNIWFISLFKPPEEAVNSMVKLGMRVYVPDDCYESIVQKVKSDLIRRFSDVIRDILEFLKVG